MSIIHVVREHQLGLDAARTEVERIAQRMHDDYGAEYHWDEDTLHFSRSGISGNIVVADDNIDLTIKLGLLLSAMKGQIEERIVKKVDAALAGYHGENSTE